MQIYLNILTLDENMYSSTWMIRAKVLFTTYATAKTVHSNSLSSRDNEWVGVV